MAGAATGSKMMTVGDLTLQPGVDTVYHIHPNTEESIFVVEGEVEMRLDGHKFRAKAGDCMVARRGLGHGIANAGDGLARFVVMYPSASPEREITEEPEWKSGAPDQGVFFRDRVESFEFTPGVSRYDMVGDFLGSESSYFSELTLQPGSTTQNHYHPAHEESMFCLSGTIDAVYEDDNNLQLNEGDLFLCEPGLRHGVYNDGDEVAVLLALHPVLNPVPRVDVD
jgi:putative monooxygenase